MAYIPTGDQAARWNEMTDPILYERLAKLEAAVADLRAQMEVMQHAIEQLEARSRRHEPTKQERAAEERSRLRR